MKILLFDIDGTLMLSGGAGRRAIDRAFFELYGITGAFDGIVPDGNTDPKIFSEIVANHSLRIADEANAFEQLAACYADHMRTEMRLSEGAHLMPGVVPLLDHLSERSDISLGLLTGNFETTARIKLDRFDLNRFFRYGAFSSDHADREHLVPVAVERAEAQLGRRIGLGRHVVVVGDTPMDVACALANGATAIGVAASRYTIPELEAAGAHAVFGSLATLRAFTDVIDAIDADPNVKFEAPA